VVEVLRWGQEQQMERLQASNDGREQINYTIKETMEFGTHYYFICNCMLPTLRKPNDFAVSETKVYQPPRELSQYEPRKEPVSRESGRASSKAK
jgi:hypothetical protein